MEPGLGVSSSRTVLSRAKHHGGDTSATAEGSKDETGPVLKTGLVFLLETHPGESMMVLERETNPSAPGPGKWWQNHAGKRGLEWLGCGLGAEDLGSATYRLSDIR